VRFVGNYLTNTIKNLKIAGDWIHRRYTYRKPGFLWGYIDG